MDATFAWLANATTHLAPAVTNLYQGVDKTQLNVLELAWMSWYERFDSPVVATGVMSFLLHEVGLGSCVRAEETVELMPVLVDQIVYFGRCIPFMIMDQIKFFRKWKLQPVSSQVLEARGGADGLAADQSAVGGGSVEVHEGGPPHSLHGRAPPDLRIRAYGKVRITACDPLDARLTLETPTGRSGCRRGRCRSPP